jgi:L-ascorbate metabolism protein UlaG (beta-lactamase superfamily)
LSLRAGLALACWMGATPAPAAAPPSPAPVRVTYLANEGVLVDGPCAVLVDALFRDSLGAYERHAPDVQQSLETARPPFDRVRLALATHYHLDHWDAGAIARFLVSSPAAVFASTPEATAMMPYELRERVRALRPGATAAPIEGSGARVDAFTLEHGQTPHLAYRVDCGGRILVHLGDATPGEANFARLLRAAPSADVALVPHWWLTSDGGRAFVTGRWKPRHVVALHVGGDDAEGAAAIRRLAPDAWVCTRPGESRTY